MSDREDKCPDPVPAAPPKVDPKPPAAESIAHAMSNREERIEKAHIAFTQHLDWEKDEEHGGIICSECGWSFGEMPVEPEARQLHALRAAAPFLESSPAPDEVVVKDAYQRGYEAGRRDDSQQGNRVRIEIDREVARIFAGPDAGVFGPRCFGAQAELTRAVRAALEEKEEA